MWWGGGGVWRTPRGGWRGSGSASRWRCWWAQVGFGREKRARLQRHVDSSWRAGRPGVARVMRPDSESRCGVTESTPMAWWISSAVQ